jgi:hypothetical protein
MCNLCATPSTDNNAAWLADFPTMTEVTVWLTPRDSAGGLLHGPRVAHRGHFHRMSTRSPGFAQVDVDGANVLVPANFVCVVRPNVDGATLWDCDCPECDRLQLDDVMGEWS